MAPPTEGDQDQGRRNNDQRPEGDMRFDPRGEQTPVALTDTSENEKWLLIGISFFALAAGLLIAIKKKD